MLLKILIGLAVFVLILVIVISKRPEDFRVSRSITMNASPEKIFPHVNNLHKWEVWSPWAKLDPNAKNTYEGPTEGVGAGLSWAGNNQLGEGRMTITDSQPSSLVRFTLEFLKPFKATNTAEFGFQAQGDQTVVTWVMFGKNNFISKAVGLFMDCDKMVGTQFEQGLASMKQTVEHDG